MICENCNKRTAKIHVTNVINGQRTDMHLCEMCAKENSQSDYGYPFGINSFLSSLLDIPIGYTVKGTKDNTDKYKCSNCGLTFEEFKSTGKLGCNECYTVFNDKLIPILKRIHGGIHHSGKLPQRIGGSIKVKREVERLKIQLDKAIKDEEFEKAAELRDKIRQYEKSMEGKG